MPDKKGMDDDRDFEFALTVLGDPRSKGRPRFTRGGRTYTPKDTVIQETAIADQARAAGATPYDGPCGVEADFFCATRRRTDGDNLMKLVLDALNGVAYTDDYLVEEVRYRVHRKVEGEIPRTEIFVYALAI